ncbi:uncharacterized protein [Choristoneura fumiferana]|uniref:uncharacterized protein n=1 Tax=Choristoneura fumiferana TaxID=7141 RepID=UPI003D15A669
MSPLARSLLALTVVTLLHGACAGSLGEANLGCTTVSGGKQEGVKKVLDTIYIPAGRRSTTVDLPTLCTDNNNLAENVTVCDDEPPTVRVRKWPTEHWLHTSVDVIRRGDYEAYHASFVFTYWCPY